MGYTIIPPSELTDADYKILEYIERFNHVSKKELVTNLRTKVDAVEYRIKNLSSIDYQTTENINSNYIMQECKNDGEIFGGPKLTPINSYHISELGKKTLQDYRLKRKHEMRVLRLKSIWLPIVVAIPTTILTTIIIHLLQWLLPMILK